MVSVSLYFKVHQPYRLKRYSVFQIGQDPDYFTAPIDHSVPLWQNTLSNEAMLKKVADKCYRPANHTLLELLDAYPELKISYSLTGVFIEQLQQWAPDVLESFQQLAATNQVTFLGEPYYHSLSFLQDKEEFTNQVGFQEAVLKDMFGARPQVFSNTEAAYNNDIGRWVHELGYSAAYTEGAHRILDWRSPNFVYRHPDNALRLLLKNYQLSDDIAFRFHDSEWSEWPLTADKFAHWIQSVNGNGEVVNLAMDYETLGEHQWQESGIFSFLQQLPAELLQQEDIDFVWPREAIQRYSARDAISVPDFISWADAERDLSAWQENNMQQIALQKLFQLKPRVMQIGDSGLIEAWRRLQTSDHFYYMCTKWFADGDIHKHFNAYESPYDAFISFMNALKDLEYRVQRTEPHINAQQPPSAAPQNGGEIENGYNRPERPHNRTS